MSRTFHKKKKHVVKAAQLKQTAENILQSVHGLCRKASNKARTAYKKAADYRRRSERIQRLSVSS